MGMAIPPLGRGKGTPSELLRAPVGTEMAEEGEVRVRAEVDREQAGPRGGSAGPSREQLQPPLPRGGQGATQREFAARTRAEDDGERIESCGLATSSARHEQNYVNAKRGRPRGCWGRRVGSAGLSRGGTQAGSTECDLARRAEFWAMRMAPKSSECETAGLRARGVEEGGGGAAGAAAALSICSMRACRDLHRTCWR